MFLLTEVVIEVVYLTAEAVFLSGVVSGRYNQQRHVVAEQASFRGYHELFFTLVLD